MAEIQGIKIEFSADVTKLNDGLKRTESTLSKTQSELKKVNRSLKFNPGNTVLLKQKFELLQRAVTETRTKLNQLNQMKAKFEQQGVDKNSKQFRELEREIIRTDNQLKKAEAELKRFGTVGQQQVVALGNKMKTLGTKIAGVGRSLTTHLSMPLTLVGAMAGRTTADFDSSMSKVQAISGATGAEFEKLRSKAREMAASTKFSATESADALGYMAMAGWKTADMLDGLEGIMYLAAASGEDLATTSDIVTDALTAFGLEAKDSAHFADVLAVASSNANTNVGMMGETFKYVAPVAGALGFSAEDTAEAIGLMANAGIKSSQAGTSLRRIMNSLTKDFEISGDAIGDVVIKTTNADGSMKSLSEILKTTRKYFTQLSESEQAAAAEALVGKNAMSGFLAIMNASPKDIKKLEDALNNADGAAEQMMEVMQDNFGGQLEILKSQLAEAGIAIGDTLIPFMKKLTAIVQTLVEKFNALSPTAKKIIVVIGIILTALGPLITMIGMLVAAVGSIMTFAPMIAGAAGAVGAAIGALAGPIGIAIAAIAAAIAIGVLLYKNWDKIKAWAKKAWTAIKTIITNAANAIKTNVTAKFNALKTIIQNIWTNIKTKVSTVVSSIKEKVSSVFSSIKDTASRVWNGIKDAIISPIESAKEKVSEIVEKLKGFFPLSVGKIFSNLKIPHINISGGKAPYGIGGFGTKPTISVDWYKRAMGNPYLFSDATLFGAGESGDEVLYGRNNLMKDIAAAVAGANAQPIVMNVYGSDNMSVNELAIAVEQKLIQMTKRRTNAWQ